LKNPVVINNPFNYEQSHGSQLHGSHMHSLQLFLLHGSQLQLQFDLTIRTSFFKVMDNI